MKTGHQTLLSKSVFQNSLIHFIKYLLRFAKPGLLKFMLSFGLTFFLTEVGYCQYPLKINVQVLPPYSPYLKDYLGFKDKVIINVSNTSSQDQNFFLRASLTNNNNFSAKTKEDFKPLMPVFIKAGQSVSLIADETSSQSFKEENIEVEYGDYKIEDILRDGVLPDGKYTLCLVAFDFNNLMQLSDENTGCKSFVITYLNAPKILNCNNKSITKTTPQNINFNWAPIIGNLQNVQVVYDLYIAPLHEEDNPQDVIETGIALNVPNIIKVSDIPINTYNYSTADYLLDEGKYAWAVKARVVDGNIPVENDGLSNVCTFDYNPMMLNLNDGKIEIGPNCDCKTKLPNNLSALNGNPLNIGSVIKSGNLLVTITKISRTEKGFSGEGTVPLPIINSGMVKVRVNFTDIDIQTSNEEYYQKSGIIHASIDQNASFLPKFNPLDPNSLNLSPEEVQSLSSYFETYAKKLVTDIKNYPNTLAYDLPIGLDEKAMNIAITNLVLMPEQAYFDAVSILDIIDGKTKVALAGQGICVDEKNFCGNAKLSLIENFVIPSIGISLNGNAKNDGTFITFNKEGFENLHISASYTFPANSLIDPKDQTPAKVTLITDTKKGWNDWVAEVNFSKFYMAGFPEMTFGPDEKGTKMFYDHSDTRNPEGIPSPYVSEDPQDQPIQTNKLTWRGFYIPSIAINLPASLTNINGQPLVIKAEKLIFDGGISGNVSVNNIMSISDGTLDGWYYSIDQFKINIWQNTFKSSSMSGKMVLPISKDYKDASNQLDYTCTLSKPKNSDLDYNFLISPKDNIAFNVLWAKCKFYKGSNIQIIKSNEGKFTAKAELFGQMAIQTQIDKIPNINIVEVKFEKLSFQSQKPYFSPGETNACFFSMASPQHSIAGFSIDFDPTPGKGISLYTNNKNANNIELGLKFKAQLKLVKDVDFVPKADVEFNVFGNLAMNGARPNWDGVGANISSIKLDAGAKIGPIGVKGELAYFNDNAGSYGFMGAFEMNVAEVVTLGAKAQFGYSSNEGGFNYFFIDGMVDFKNAGIPLGPCLAIYGFGGGVYYNMSIPDLKLDGSNVKGSPPYNFDKDNPQAGVSLSGIVYTPKKGLFSVKAAILFGLTSRSVLDADGSVTMTFNASTGGVEDILFAANGRFISKTNESLTDRNNNCMGKLEIVTQMNFAEKSFLFHADVKAGVPTYQNRDIFYLSANLNFYSGPSGWFVHVGRPWKDGNFNGGEPIQITVLKTFNFRGYFQCGNGSGKIFSGGQIVSGINSVDPMPPIPNYIIGIINYNNREGENGRIENSVSQFNLPAPEIKGGLAFGANFSTSIDVNFLIFYLKADFMAGFDLGFYELTKDAICVNEAGQQMLKGVNGFYATGQAYLGASIDVGVEIDLFFFSGKISIVSAGAAAYVNFGGPQPTYASGALGGYFSVLGGLISGNFAVKFYWGEKCYLLQDESIDLISEVNPSGEFNKKNYAQRVTAAEKQPVNIQPWANFNFEIDRTFLIIANASEKNPDDPSATYRQYRYYHILPSDITINTSGGLIEQDGAPIPKPLNINDFEVSNDHFSLQLKNPVMFERDHNFSFDIWARVRIFNLREQSKNQANAKQGYKDENELAGVNNFNRYAWDFAKTKDDKVFVDERHVNFTTDCGIKTIDEAWVSNISPFHRSQNNPTGVSPTFNQNQLREGSKFTPVYNMASLKNDLMAIQTTNKNLAFNKSLAQNEIFLNLDNGYLGEKFLCIPPDFVNNFEYKLKVSTFGKTNSGNSFATNYFNAQISGDKKTAFAKANTDWPKESYIVVQLVLKRKQNVNNNQNNDLKSKFVTSKVLDDKSINLSTTILARSVSLESKLSGKKDEMELFRWYFTTGNYPNYRDKMADLTIKIDTATVNAKSFNINKGGIETGNFKVLATTYSFLGKEKFDFHDLKDYSLGLVFESNGSKASFPKKLDDGYLGFAFDNVSQETVDGFLRTYFDTPELKLKWNSFASNGNGASNPEESSIKGMLVGAMNSYITDKMFDVVKWSNITKYGVILQPLDKLPSDLFYKSNYSMVFQFSMINTKPEVLFSLERLSKVLKYEGSTTKIIPSHIINMKDIADNLPGNGSIQLQSYLADAMQNFNDTVMPNVIKGFNPSFLNNKSNFKK